MEEAEEPLFTAVDGPVGRNSSSFSLPESPSERSEARSLLTASSSSWCDDEAEEGGAGSLLCLWGDEVRGFIVTGSKGTCGTSTGGGGEGDRAK